MKVFLFSKQAVQYTCNKNRLGALSIADTEKDIYGERIRLCSVFFYISEHTFTCTLCKSVHVYPYAWSSSVIGKKSEV